MSNHPPSPPTPTPSPTATPASHDRITVTTTQFAATIADAADVSLAPATLETLLLEFDRRDYVEWVTVTRDGEYVWDLTESPDRIAEVVAAAVAARVESWVETQLEGE